MNWLWSRSVHYFRKWVDFGPEVFTIFENELTLVQKCSLFSKMNWLWWGFFFVIVIFSVRTGGHGRKSGRYNINIGPQFWNFRFFFWPIILEFRPSRKKWMIPNKRTGQNDSERYRKCSKIRSGGRFLDIFGSDIFCENICRL